MNDATPRHVDEAYDPYLWLEDVEGPEALAWVREQSARTSEALRDESFVADKTLIYEISTRPSNIPYVIRRGAFLYNFWQDAQHVRGLWRRTSLESYRRDEPDWEILIDLDALAREEGEDWVWRGCVTLEPEHRYGLVSLSRGGADASVTREFDLQAKRFVAGGFALPEAKGGASWLDAETLIASAVLGQDEGTTSGYPRLVRRWARGEDFADASIAFEGERSDVAVSGHADREPGFEREFYRRQITFEEGESFVRYPGGDLVRIDLPLDARYGVVRDFLFVRLKSDWEVGGARHPADALLAIGFSRFLAGERDFTVLFAPSHRRTLASFFFGRSRLVFTVLDNLVSRVFVAKPDGEGNWSVARMAGLPEEASLDAFALDAASCERTDEFLVAVSDFLKPASLLLVREDDTVETLKTAPAAFDASGLAVTRHEAVSVDGEAIPYFEIGPKRRTGPAPTLLTGYGGFAVSLTPSYLGASGAVWCARGGVHVVANIRGGGEFGPGWHKSGMRAGKRLSHDDFAAVARDLIARGVTVPERLAAYGGSNGGLLVGNMLTRYPKLFGAVWCAVPLLDMRRYTKLLAGASWMAEYGDPDEPGDWAFIEGFSAYHQVRPDGAYPPVFFVTSRRDDRVHPGHARKMAARMQEMGLPAMFFEPEEGGHGAANKEQAAMLSALGYSFLRKTIGRP